MQPAGAADKSRGQCPLAPPAGLLGSCSGVFVLLWLRYHDLLTHTHLPHGCETTPERGTSSRVLNEGQIKAGSADDRNDAASVKTDQSEAAIKAKLRTQDVQLLSLSAKLEIFRKREKKVLS